MLEVEGKRNAKWWRDGSYEEPEVENQDVGVQDGVLPRSLVTDDA